MDCGRTLLQDVFDAQLQISRVANKAVGVRHSGEVSIYLMIYITPRMMRDNEMKVIYIYSFAKEILHYILYYRILIYTK